MNDLVQIDPQKLAQIDDEIAHMTPEERLNGLKSALMQTVEGIVRAGRFVVHMRARGEDITDAVISAMEDWLIWIGTGAMLPQVYFFFLRKPSLIDIIGRLPVADQMKYVSGELVEVVVPAPGGGLTKQMMLPENMGPAQLSQVFGRMAGGARFVCDEGAQKSHIQEKSMTVRKARKEKIDDLVTVDRERGGIQVRCRGFISKDELLKCIKALK